MTIMEARRLLTKQFASFDAGKAQCFLARDRERLLAVIEAGFGDYDDFNRVARKLLDSASRTTSFLGTSGALARIPRAPVVSADL